ncbi:MAG: CPBP family glutamic-type intramembrane protease [Saccharofermentans sp.]|nr:CPBP family glutamic-type intramembrane protease [Saccharofermentans sp.]
MLKNKIDKGQLAIAGQILGFGSHNGTKVSVMTFLVCIGFIWTTIVYFFAIMCSWYGFNDLTHGSRDVVVINAPESFRNFADKHEPDFNISYDSWDAIYDYNHAVEIMSNNNAGIAIVFNEESHDILTYYRTNSPDQADFRNDFVDGWLQSYFTQTIPTYNPEVKWEIIESQIQTQPNLPSYIRLQRSLAQTSIPLTLFIAILYVAMSSGTEAIAGQKERGTFAGLILSPMKRSSIVLGFTYGVFIKTLIPAIIIHCIILLFPFYLSWESIFGVLALIVGLAFFIASLAVMISIITDSVTSAQTAFLPIFFILVVVAVTCINESAEPSSFYYYLPVYGQFYGIGACLNREANILGIIVSTILTIGMGIAMTFISTKFIHNERFIVSYSTADTDSYNDKLLPKIFDKIIGFIDLILYPLAILSIYQLLAMIPVAISYMKDPAYSNFIADLRDVNSVPEVVAKTTEIIGIFMNDSRFLALMTIGYLLIIFTYMIRARGLCGIGLKRRGFVRHYITGAIVGILMMSAVFGLLCVTGLCKPEGFGLPSGTILTFAFSILMWFPQGAAEEVMFRGFMIPKLKGLVGKPAAIIISSLLFSVFHTMNAGFSFVALANIFLFAILFAWIYEMTGSIAFSCAAHTMWNMFQGSIYGLSVSGNETLSLLSSNYTGSDFGPEGTIEATIVIVLALILVAWLNKRLSARQTLPSY